MEIERKFLIKKDRLPEMLSQYPCRKIEQGYLCTDPVLRVRRAGDDFYLTCKGKGLMIRAEHELPLSEAAYRKLLAKSEGNIITKKRYCIPHGSLTIELDLFEGIYEGLIMAEVEFSTAADAESFSPPGWFGPEVTQDPRFQNSNLSRMADPAELLQAIT